MHYIYIYIYIIYVTPSHKTSLNSLLADKRYITISLLGVNLGDFHFVAKMHS